MSEFSHYRRKAPEVPSDTCPTIDGIIRDLECLRADNAALRESSQYWRDAAEELSDRLEAAEKQIEELKDELDSVSA